MERLQRRAPSPSDRRDSAWLLRLSSSFVVRIIAKIITTTWTAQVSRSRLFRVRAAGQASTEYAGLSLPRRFQLLQLLSEFGYRLPRAIFRRRATTLATG